MPELPRFEFMTLPPAHTFVSKKLQQCNWAQACEGALDTAHFSFLHMSVGDDERRVHAMKVIHQSEAAASGDKNRVRWMKNDGMPRFTVTEHDAGLLMGAARTADNGDLYWRISQFMLPSHALAPSAFPGENYHGQTFVPIDDELCWIYCYTWNPERPLTNSERERFSKGHTVHANVDKNWMPIRNRDNDYLIDREDAETSQLHRHHGRVRAGCLHPGRQGFIADRTREKPAYRHRHRAVPPCHRDAAKNLNKGKEPTAVKKPEATGCVRAARWRIPPSHWPR